MTDYSVTAKLDPREQHFRIPGPREGLLLFLRFLPATNSSYEPRRAVLYVHGATFPSALSIAHRFDGRSWRDALNEAGFDVWGLDFYGFGHSDRYVEMGRPAAAMAEFFTDSFRRRTGQPLRIVMGEVDTAGLVALASSDRPSLYLVDAPARTPWVTDKDIRENGAVVMWPASDTTSAPPPVIAERYPDLVPEVPRSFERTVQGRLPLLRIGWALIRPAR